MRRNKFTRQLLVSSGLTSLLMALPVHSQTAPQPTAEPVQSSDQQPAGSPAADAPPQEQDIVIVGFRAALDNALNLKRQETAAVDSIVAEDIGKFPDSNLAESMQRIPGVALSRGDGGEGRNISVRGLGAQFTRVRINGMEGVSQVSGSDIRGGVATGRSFDFVTFPTEIFSSLAVRKTLSADVEEGSLGATVDLRAPKPFDQKKDFVFSGTVRGIYNDISKKADPRLSALVSKKFGDAFGVLASAAYSKRHIEEYAYSAVDVVPTTVYGLAQPAGSANAGVIFPFCTPVGYVYNGAPVSSPVGGYTQPNGTPIGSDANNCSTGNPRTGTQAAYDYIMSRTGVNGRPGGGVYLPRLPRPVKSTQDQERIAGTLTLQWKPTDDTDISIDGLYSRFKVNRLDQMFDGRSFGRAISNNGQPLTSVREIEVDDNGSLIHGLFDGVDLRSEMQDERFTSTYRQVNLNLDHRFSDSFRVFGLAGINESKLDVNRLQVAIDSNDSRNFSIDFRDNPDIPKIGYGIDTTNAALFRYGPPLANGDQQGQLSNFIRRNTITSKTFELNTEWKVAPGFTIQTGGQYRTNRYTARERQLATGTPLALPAGVALSSFTTVTTGVGSNLDGQLQDFVSVDPDKFRAAVGLDSYVYCSVECAKGTYGGVDEKYKSGYLMVKFNTEETLPFALRGDAGVRYVHTRLDTYGPITTAAPAGSTYPSRFVISEVGRSYEDWLPSVNVALDITPNLIARASAARVMSRPSYGQLIPAGSANLVIQTASFSNPFLEPIRANTFDAALEWYFAPGSLISAAYFYKDIETYIQTTSQQVAFQDIGLPLTLLNGTQLRPTDQFTVQRSNNTPGGPLRGFELNVQLPFRFLPGALRNFGALANYTRVRSNINYVISPTLSRTAPLVGLSPETASGTLYYEDSKFSIRSTVNYRAAFLTAVPSGSVDADSTSNASSVFIDASASYNLSDNIKLIAEVSNITNETNRLTVDTVRQDPLYTAYFGRTFALAVNFQF
ncbi:TonB-dependent receptor [Sphingomonas naasensis]|uniref:TonB-dependent receptor n=1 Tax=Sphingomonas naasensis TaxID=1344951 RepID=A0A4V3QXF8_9SPHN|nr:TonB-dependent receptor [Sphingomonas naasensis]NIJ19087.1 TonB-dependent receptor [Sphingomonas naasensis]TGX46282.1 TonB-dependent receptor [Sphingomonas naasensis]